MHYLNFYSLIDFLGMYQSKMYQTL